MAVQAYLNFNGNCHEAVDYYAEVFRTEKPKIMLFGDMPPDEKFPMNEETKSLVMHATLTINGSVVMFSDVPPGLPYIAGNNISLIINSNDKDEMNSIFQKLSVEGTIGMELQETFWSKYYGAVTDKYGIGWQLNFQSE